jgi:hypothetical protein
MSRTLIDFAGEFGSRVPFSVYEVELDASGQPKVKKAVFVPHSAQQAFFSATERHVLLHGNRGCGKSASLLWKAVQTAFLVPGSRVAIYRKTWPELKRSIWDELLKLPSDLFSDINASDHTVTVRAKDAAGDWKLSKIWFVTAENVEDARKVLSFEVHTLLIDEWSAVEPEIWRFMSGSVRSPISRDIAGRPSTSQILGGSTPGGAGSEALRCLFGTDGPKRQMIGQPASSYRPEQYRAIRASIDLNPTYAVGTMAGDTYRAALKDLPLVYQSRWIRGEWGAVEGAYFSGWNEEINTLAHETVIRLLAAQPYCDRWIGIDVGKVHASAAYWNASILVQGRDGSALPLIVTYRELTDSSGQLLTGLSEKAIAQMIADMTEPEEKPYVRAIYLSPELGDPKTLPLCRAGRMSDVFLAEGLPGTQPAFNRRPEGWAMMATKLDEHHQVGGGKCSTWVIDRTCQHALRAIPSAVNDPKAAREFDIVKTDSPLDDCLDAIRYSVASWLSLAPPADVPPEVRHAEAMRPIVEGMLDESLTDAERTALATSAMVRHRQMTAEESACARPIRLGRRRW